MTYPKTAEDLAAQIAAALKAHAVLHGSFTMGKLSELSIDGEFDLVALSDSLLSDWQRKDEKSR